MLGALEQAARTRKIEPEGELKHVTRLFADPSAKLGAAALRLAGAWKLEDLRPAMIQYAGDKAGDPERRQAAVAALVDLADPTSIQDLAGIAAGNRPFPVRRDAAIGLATLDTRKAAD